MEINDALTGGKSRRVPGGTLAEKRIDRDLPKGIMVLSV